MRGSTDMQADTAADETAPAPRGAGAPGALHERYDTALLDLDGVVYTGGVAVEHAVPALRVAREAGMRLGYVTNNAARTPQTVADHLSRLGVPATPDEVVTSAQAVARLMAERLPAGAAVLCVGGEGLRVALRERGLAPVESADAAPEAVVQGYGGPDMTWGMLAEAAIAVQRGVPWFASNLDLTIPGERGITPGNGSAVAMVRAATGRRWGPEVAGKPLPPMHRESILRTGARRPLVVGDRLDTDIEGAHAGGVDSLLVLTGVTSPAQLLAARPEHRPTYVAADLRALLVPYPEVVRDGDGFRCGGWHAAARSGRLCLTEAPGDGFPADRVDGLRALCAAAWEAAGEAGGAAGETDAPGTAEGDEALARLGF